MNYMIMERERWEQRKKHPSFRMILLLDYVFVLDHNGYEVIKDRSGKNVSGAIIETYQELCETYEELF